MPSDHPLLWILLVALIVLLGRWHERAGRITRDRVR